MTEQDVLKMSDVDSVVPSPGTSDDEGGQKASGLDSGVVGVVGFVSSDKSAGTVPVRISYGIIERFSEGLYSSPNKTFEELITNSYDAGAGQVWVYLASDLTDTNAKLAVIDDGESMDLKGLTDLWKIGESKKRASLGTARRKPVGKFGIGKLATYVLAQKLTYITHRDSEYLAVTMDYRRVSPKVEILDSVDLSLDVVSLTKAQALYALSGALDGLGLAEKAKAIDGVDALDHWTAAVLSDLKPNAREIKLGRLRWVLRSALPLNPGFGLSLNDEPVTSSKVDGEETWSFVIGRNEDQLGKNADRKWGPGTPTTVTTETREETALKLPAAGAIWGRAVLYKDPLQRGKSEELGRSHGFFVRVRGRLINLDDKDFSVGPELRHGTFTRFWMEVNADDLDDHVASARESIRESPGLDELKNYLLAVFNKARVVSAEKDDSDIISNIGKDGRLAKPSSALSQGPLRRMLGRAVGGDSALVSSLGLNEESLDEAERVLSDGGDVVRGVLIDDRRFDGPFAVYEPSSRSVVLNQGHPFISNYIGGKTVAEPLKLLGLTEVLTQAYLLEENIAPEIMSRIMGRRDAFLRELTMRFPRSAPVIARRLKDSTNDENALEDAVGDALELLGFAVIRLGGASHGADGIAIARLGKREGVSHSYAFTYDAKSTKDAVRAALSSEEEKVPGKIRADTARTSVLRVHRERAAERHALDVKPEFTLLIAPDYQGASDNEGLINDVCRNDKITAIRVDDLARLVNLFALQGINPTDLRSLFDCRTPEETRQWVADQSDRARIPRPPVSVVVETLVENSERKIAISTESLGAYLAVKGHDLELHEIESLVRGLAALAPKSVYSDGKFVALNATPSALYDELRVSLSELDPELAGDYLKTVPEETGDGNAK